MTRHEAVLEIRSKMRETLMHTYHFRLPKEGKVIINRDEVLPQIMNDGYKDLGQRIHMYEASAIATVTSFPELFGHYYQDQDERIRIEGVERLRESQERANRRYPSSPYDNITSQCWYRSFCD